MHTPSTTESAHRPKRRLRTPLLLVAATGTAGLATAATLALTGPSPAQATTTQTSAAGRAATSTLERTGSSNTSAATTQTGTTAKGATNPPDRIGASATTSRTGSVTPVTSSGGGGRTSDDSADGAAAYTACMRSHGIAGFPGVTFSKDGRVNLKLTGSGVNPVSARYQAAAEACASLLPRSARLPAQPARPSFTPPQVPQCEADCPPTPSAPKAPADPS